MAAFHLSPTCMMYVICICSWDNVWFATYSADQTPHLSSKNQMSATEYFLLFDLIVQSGQCLVCNLLCRVDISSLAQNLVVF